MNIALTFKNFEPSDHLRNYATRRFEKLGRFIHKAENVTMTAVLTVDKFRHKAEVQFTGDAVNISAVEQSSDMYATVDMVLDKLEAQLKKQAERMKEKRRSGSREFAGGEMPDAPQAVDKRRIIVDTDKFEPKPLFAEEAALQMEHRDDEVIVFLNAETERVNVIYRRKNGDFGLVDPIV